MLSGSPPPSPKRVKPQVFNIQRPNLGSIAGQQSILDESIMPPLAQPRKVPAVPQPVQRPNLGSIAGQQNMLGESIMPPPAQPRKAPAVQQPVQRPNLGSIAGQQSILDESIMPPPAQPRKSPTIKQPVLPKLAVDENGGKGNAKEGRQPGIPPQLMQLHNPTPSSDLLGALLRPSMGAQQLNDQDDII
jgi:hypothetical protein